MAQQFLLVCVWIFFRNKNKTFIFMDSKNCILVRKKDMSAVLDRFEKIQIKSISLRLNWISIIRPIQSDFQWAYVRVHFYAIQISVFIYIWSFVFISITSNIDCAMRTDKSNWIIYYSPMAQSEKWKKIWALFLFENVE